MAAIIHCFKLLIFFTLIYSLLTLLWLSQMWQSLVQFLNRHFFYTDIIYITRYFVFSRRTLCLYGYCILEGHYVFIDLSINGKFYLALILATAIFIFLCSTQKLKMHTCNIMHTCTIIRIFLCTCIHTKDEFLIRDKYGNF